jgi:hypothetical protein
MDSNVAVSAMGVNQRGALSRSSRINIQSSKAWSYREL